MGRATTALQGVCFVLRVRPDRLAEYRERHRHVWPEMQDALRASGWSNYSLFSDAEGVVVGYLECADFAAASAAMAATEVNARWQAETAEFFEDLSGHSPDIAISPLLEIFHLP